MTTFIGIDPGMASMCVAAITDGWSSGLKNVSVRTLAVKKMTEGILDDHLRSKQLESSLRSLLFDLTPISKPRVCIHGEPIQRVVVTVEGPSFGRDPTRSLQTGFVHSAIYRAIEGKFAKNFNTVVVVSPPTVLKKFVSGKGTASKGTMIECTIRRWFKAGVPSWGSDDKYDAFGLAMLGVEVLNGKAERFNTQKVRAHVYEMFQGEFIC
ncbi:MAG: hypothetical protein KKB59_19990 [Spirochaetes bacterium]|nr:hypothetical protein [Spirochaetota bacterium]